MVTNGYPGAFLVFPLLTVAQHLLIHSVLMSNTPAHFALCFVLSDGQGHREGRLLQSRDELQKSPVPGCSLHHHRDRDVRGGGCGPHSLPVQAWTRITLDQCSSLGGETVSEWEEARLDRFFFLPSLEGFVPELLSAVCEKKLYEEKRLNHREKRSVDGVLLRLHIDLDWSLYSWDKIFHHHHWKKKKDDSSSTKTVLDLLY